MKKIIVDNKIFYVDAPNYVKKKLSTGAWIPSTKDDSEALAINGEIYNLPQNRITYVEGRPYAIIKDVDKGKAIIISIHAPALSATADK